MLTRGRLKTLAKIIADIKKILWARIGQSIIDQWQSIETIHESLTHNSLHQLSKVVVTVVIVIKADRLQLFTLVRCV